MRLGVRLRIALLAGLATAVVLAIDESAVAEQADGPSGTEMSESGEAVSIRITDLELEWDDALFVQLQPPGDAPAARPPAARTELAPRLQPGGVARRSQAESSPGDLLARYEARRRRRWPVCPRCLAISSAVAPAKRS